MKTNKLIHYSSILLVSTLGLQNIQAEELIFADDTLLTPTTESIEESKPLLIESPDANFTLEGSYVNEEQTFEEAGIEKNDSETTSEISYELIPEYQIIDKGILSGKVYRLRDDLILDDPYYLAR
jgi:hypothetical protein